MNLQNVGWGQQLSVVGVFSKPGKAPHIHELTAARARTICPDPSLSPQNASTFEDVAQVPSAYQKTVPVEAGESWQSESTV